MPKHLLMALTIIVTAATWALAQTNRPASPPGSSATQIGGKYDARAGFTGGRWLEIRYGRAIKRGRDLFGTDDYVDFLNDGAPVWRAGANQTTRLVTDAPIVVANRTIAAGEYSVFIDLAARPWTLILSSWPAQTTYDADNRTALWGAYEYTPDRDVVRAPMTRATLPYSLDQLSWQFLDVTGNGGKLAMLWDRQVAWVAFEIRP